MSEELERLLREAVTDQKSNISIARIRRRSDQIKRRRQTVSAVRRASAVILVVLGLSSVKPLPFVQSDEVVNIDATTEGLLDAVAEGSVESTQKILEAGVDPNQKDGNGVAALGVAVGQGDAELVEVLLAAGADPNEESTPQTFPLLLAAQEDSTEIVEILLSNGADPTQQGRRSQTIVHEAAANGNIEILQVALERAPQLIDQPAESWNGKTPIIVAAQNKQDEAIAEILMLGADPDSADSVGFVALHYALEEVSPSTVQVLLEGGADPEGNPNSTVASPREKARNSTSSELFR